MSRFVGRSNGPRVTSESEHQQACKHCGQWFDQRKLYDTIWHEIPEHDRWTESREIGWKDVGEYAPPELLEAFLPDLAEQLYPERPRPKAGSIYRGINVTGIAMKSR